MLNVDSHKKQTLLFKETIFGWFWASLRGWVLLLPLIVDCIGNTGSFCGSLPLFTSKGAFADCGSLLNWLGPSIVPNDWYWFAERLFSAVPTNTFRFCCSVKGVEWNSVATDLDYCIHMKSFRFYGVGYNEKCHRENKKTIIRKVSNHLIFR